MKKYKKVILTQILQEKTRPTRVPKVPKMTEVTNKGPVFWYQS